jgi:hypothetical protein
MRGLGAAHDGAAEHQQSADMRKICICMCSAHTNTICAFQIKSQIPAIILPSESQETLQQQPRHFQRLRRPLPRPE